MRMKRMAAAVVAMVTALALTACAGGFDASKYVNGVLNNIIWEIPRDIWNW